MDKQEEWAEKCLDAWQHENFANYNAQKTADWWLKTMIFIRAKDRETLIAKIAGKRKLELPNESDIAYLTRENFNLVLDLVKQIILEVM